MARTLRWKKAWIILYLTCFLMAATAGVLFAAFKSTVSIGDSICDPVGGGNSTCSNCLVDFGSDGGFCWSSQCDNQLLGYTACRTWSDSREPCVSTGACWTTCNNCNGWQCMKMNPPDKTHTTYWCYMEGCLCPDKAADWTGSWNQWPTCTQS
jgi:hypothetical protein